MSNPAGQGQKLTYDDFLLFPDDGKRHELIDGEHYVTASPNLKHQRVSGNLHLLIRLWLDEDIPLMLVASRMPPPDATRMPPPPTRAAARTYAPRVRRLTPVRGQPSPRPSLAR